MATYAQHETTTKPPGEFTLKPEHWASTFTERPLCSVALGIRLPSDADLTYVKNLAKDAADKDRALITMCVTRVVCDPEDASLAHELFQFPDLQIPDRLRPETIQSIYDELERLMIATSPLYPEATEDEVLALVESLADMAHEELVDKDRGRGMRVLRYLKFCLDELTK